jgi:L-arabinose isomerase
MLEMFAEMAGVELLVIDNDTTLRSFKNELRWNEAYFAAPGR